MQGVSSSVSTPEVRPSRDIPRAGIRVLLRSLLGGRGERVDMLSRLRELHERHGDVVIQDEFTHDVIVPLEGATAVFDST